jgi:hypothetical protein
MKPRWYQLVLTPLALIALVVVGATATTVIAKSFRSLAVEADAIFAGTVEEVRSYRRDNGRIWTAVRFGELKWLVGDGGSQRELQFAGGRIGDRAEIVGGMPQFTVGQRVVLFVRDDGTASPIVGFHQGCFGLRPSDLGETVVTPDSRPVLGIDGDELLTGEVGEPGGVSLDVFFDLVTDLRDGGVVE